MAHLFRGAWTRAPLLVTALLFSALALATELGDLATGKHSFRDLGPDFSVEVPVRPIEGKPKLVLFNQRLASTLGINTGDPEKLEAEVLRLFGKEVDPTGKSATTLIATHYQDSAEKKAGSALGDGRAVWIGELTVSDAAGKPEHLDIVLKGVGQTPLAWFNHADPRHRDGLQSIDEAVHSFIHSEASLRNGIDSTGDLAVIALPISRPDKNGGTTQAALTVRIGKQTRVAHLRYFADEPEKFKKLFDYIVRRDLKLPSDASIGPAEVETYLKTFARNLARDAAKYYDLHAVHGSPTPGNRTTGGGTIDLGTFRYLDAHHSNYSYLFEKLQLGGDKSQTYQLLQYLSRNIEYLRDANYADVRKLGSLAAASTKEFWTTYDDLTSRYALRRLGLPEEAINRVPESVRLEFVGAVRALQEAVSGQKIPAGEKAVYPAAFDTRKVLSESLGTFLQPNELRGRAWHQVFTSNRKWGTNGSAYTNGLKARYISKLDGVLRLLNPTRDELESWSEDAHRIARNERIEPGPNFFYGDEKYAVSSETLEAIRNGESFESINAKAESAIEGLVDEGLLPGNPDSVLGCSPRSPLCRGIEHFHAVACGSRFEKLLRDPLTY